MKNTNFFSQVISAVLAASVTVSLLCTNAYAAEKFEPAKEATKNMKAGINIGNTLDAHGSWLTGDWVLYDYDTYSDAHEQCWGNPMITKEYIAALKDAGFSTVRLPVTWFPHTDSKGNITKDRLDRVQEVVDWILAEDMYCIINMHHDATNGKEFLKATKQNYEKNSARVKTTWKQIAERFKDYDEKLIFEGYNEMGDSDEITAEAIKYYNKYVQLFVDTVRKTGGNNKQRNLMFQPFRSNLSKEVWDNLYVPKDSAENHLILSFHTYEPWTFTHTHEVAHWLNKNDMTDKWGSDADKKWADDYISSAAKFTKKTGIPAALTEHGANLKDNVPEVAEYAGYFAKTCAKYDMPYFWWEASASEKPEGKDSMGLMDRHKNKPYKAQTKIVEAIVLNANLGKLPAPTVKGKLSKGNVTLSWDKVGCAYGYKVYQYDNASKKYKQVDFIKGTQKTIKGLSKGSHKFKVVAVSKYNNKNTNGKSSNVVKVTVK